MGREGSKSREPDPLPNHYAEERSGDCCRVFVDLLMCEMKLKMMSRCEVMRK